MKYFSEVQFSNIQVSGFSSRLPGLISGLYRLPPPPHPDSPPPGRYAGNAGWIAEKLAGKFSWRPRGSKAPSCGRQARCSICSIGTNKWYCWRGKIQSRIIWFFPLSFTRNLPFQPAVFLSNNASSQVIIERRHARTIYCTAARSTHGYAQLIHCTCTQMYKLCLVQLNLHISNHFSSFLKVEVNIILKLSLKPEIHGRTYIKEMHTAHRGTVSHTRPNGYRNGKQQNAALRTQSPNF
jgi:hypothetical protein